MIDTKVMIDFCKRHGRKEPCDKCPIYNECLYICGDDRLSDKLEYIELFYNETNWSDDDDK